MVFAVVADGAKVGLVIADNGQECEIAFTGHRDLAAGKHADAIRVDQKCGHHLDMKRRLSASVRGIKAVERTQIELRDEVEQEEHEIVLRKSFLGTKNLATAFQNIPRAKLLALIIHDRRPLLPETLILLTQTATGSHFSGVLSRSISDRLLGKHVVVEKYNTGVTEAASLNRQAVAAAVAGNGLFAHRLLRRAARWDPSNDGVRANIHTLESDRPDLLSVRVAVLSLLYNWPSRGGGTIHTRELVRFLQKAGFTVRHLVARCDTWGVGQVSEDAAGECRTIHFEPRDWTAERIQQQFRHAARSFQPDYCIVTDSWNFKPLLAEAVKEFPTFLRLAAQECLCPLNNVRLLADGESGVTTCPIHQFADPDGCRRCVSMHRVFSGSLHEAERLLSGFAEPEYPKRLREAFKAAQGVLVVNPSVAKLIGPYCRQVHVVPSGFDPARFPWGVDEIALSDTRANGEFRVFFAGLVNEPMKGFRILQEAVRRLRASGRNVVIHATGEPRGWQNDFTLFMGWLNQQELPRFIRDADVLAFPTIAEEGLGRSAVEAMGCGRPVVASRIGGLSWTVIDGETGWLFESGNVGELVQKLESLIDRPNLRMEMGRAGRLRFEQEFTWDAVIERHYRGLLQMPSDIRNTELS